jgi:hypothetical protein
MAEERASTCESTMAEERAHERATNVESTIKSERANPYGEHQNRRASNVNHHCYG